MQTEGETLISDQASWVWIGFKFGIGFGLAGCVFAVLGMLLATAISSYAVGQLKFKMLNLVPPTARSSFNPQTSPMMPRVRTVQVPEKSGRECLAETGGVINEQYQRCTQGYSY